ncbi:MAG: tyrosine--tRNA ligase [Candidatus Zambryskibacteria bacterium]
MFGITKPKTIVDESKIDEILNRGIENVYPSKDFLKSKLMKGERVSLYLGIDPTGATLHLGHVIPLRKLGKLQELGHQIILLMGDFTGLIGDPTDKTATRKKLSREEVLNNLKDYKKQASEFISFTGSNPALIKYNSEWLAKLTFSDVVELASLVTVEQMMKRDMFQRRNQEGKPIYIHEFMYPIMQGYDCVAMDVDGEIGGNDQTFNMLVGRDFMKALKNKEKFVISTKLLVDSSGQKMGKTEGNMVSLDQTPEDMFGRVMSWSDNLIIHGFEIVTDVPLHEIKEMEEKLASGINPKEMKMRLAREIVKMCHGEKGAEEAERAFENTFSKGEFPNNAQTITASKGDKLMDVLVNNKIIESKSEFRRLVEAGAVSDYPDKKIDDPNETVGGNERKIKIGKKIFVIIKPD